MRAIAAYVTALPFLSLLAAALEARAIRVQEHECLPTFRWLAWGTMQRPFGNGIRSFFILKLPSWRWQERWDRIDETWEWHRAWVLWTSTHGWRVIWEPDPTHT